MTMNNTTLADLDWHTLSTIKRKSRYISLYHAIAVILAREKGLRPYLKQYINYLDEAEFHAAIEILDRHNEANDEISLDDLTEPNDIYNYVCIPDLTIYHIEAIRYLDEQRARVCEFIGPPVSIIYALLRSEIEKYKHKRKKPSLRIIKKPIDNPDIYYFNRKDLKKWKSLSAIRDLGLLDKSIYTSIKQRSDLEDYRKKSAGMLTYILTKIPPFKHGNHMRKFTRSKTDPKINPHAIYKFFEDVFSDEFGPIDKYYRIYPGESTFKNNIKEMHEYFEKNSNSPK